jgi:hypothetical protein
VVPSTSHSTSTHLLLISFPVTLQTNAPPLLLLCYFSMCDCASYPLQGNEMLLQR